MDKFTLVTGADHGLGFELVRKLLIKGYNVFAGCYLSKSDQYQDLCKEYGDTLQIIHLDISDIESVQRAREDILRKTDRLDLLLNNAAVLGDIHSTIEDQIDFDDIENVIKVNAIGALKVTNIMFPLLLKGENKLIVTISSEAGSIGDCPRDSWFGYCMSKAALNMEAALIQNHFNKYQGQVMVIHPGWMKTYMRGHLDADAELTPEYSAECIMNLIDNSRQYRGEKAVYLDYSGKQLNW
jgi:NAD(P)-dependent dehydrogenase (short-subunit alcohol dehydrogenase family)